MFRNGGAGPLAGGSSSGGGANGTGAAASSSSSNGTSSTSSAASTMMNFARALGMTSSKSQQHTPAAPPPADLPNPQTPNNAANDTNSVFYVDDTLSEVARVRRYALSQLPLQRLVYVKRISACARSVGLKETLTQLVPLFAKLVVDQEAVVRTAAASELANLAHFLADPNQPFQPTVYTNATNGTLHPTSKPPPTAQSPDLTLEDEQILDLEVSDVDNTLSPDARLTSNGVGSVGAAIAAIAGDTQQNGASAASAAAANNTSDAMEVDSVAAPTPVKPADEPVDSSDAMDVSTDNDVVVSTETETEQGVATTQVSEAEAAAAASSAAISAASSIPPASPEEKVTDASGSHTPRSPASAASASPATPSSPLSVPAASPATASSSSSSSSSASLHANSPLHDPTSAIRMESYEHIKDTMIPSLQTLILDNNAEVRAAACDSLVRVADVLRGDDVGKVVLTLVLNLAHDERDEQRTTAVHLMHELAPRLGHDLCRSFVALELAAFADDSTFRVRKATAQSFGNVCEMVGESFTAAKLLPCYVRLSKDLIWGVRKGCVESLVAVTRVASPSVKSDTIIPMFERFAHDSSRWVRNGAYEILGPFLHALGPALASKELVAYYANIPSMSSAIVDQEVNYHAAFNLPAVLQTVGRERWEELSGCFQALMRDTKFPVRRTLAYSLHELAALLGAELTEQALLPALDAFLRDLDEVRYGVLKSFSLLLRCISPARRVNYLEVLWMVQKQSEQWRWRLLWAKQLGAFARLFSAELTVSDIIPLTFALCRDQVAAVRRTAAKALGRLLVRVLAFQQPNQILATCITDIHAFATSATYMDRQLYLKMLEGFIGLLPDALFEEFLQRALPLAADKTSNVRLACVVTMRALMQHQQFHTSPTAAKIVQTLSQDGHKEVKRSMHEAIHANTTTAAAAAALTSTLAGLDISTTSPALAPSRTNSDSLSASDLDDILAGASSVNSAPASSTETSQAELSDSLVDLGTSDIDAETTASHNDALSNNAATDVEV